MLKFGSKYTRKEVNAILEEPPVFDTGIHRCKKSKRILLYTDLIKKESDQYAYQDYFENDYFHWDSQNPQDINTPTIQRMVRKEVEVLLFCRIQEKIKGKTQKFVYCGRLEYRDHDSSTAKPVHMIFKSLDYQDDNENKDLIDLWEWKPRQEMESVSQKRHRTRASQGNWVLTWNRKSFPWLELTEQVRRIRSSKENATSINDGSTGIGRWSCGRNKRIKIGDRLFMLKQGNQPRGIVGVAEATSNSYTDTHWSDSNKTSQYVDLLWRVLLDPDTDDLIKINDLSDTAQSGFNWQPRGGGYTLPHEIAEEIDDCLQELYLGTSPSLIASLLEDQTAVFPETENTEEGAWRIVKHRRRERKSLRKERLQKMHLENGHYFCECCGTVSLDTELPQSILEVHHIFPLAGHDGARVTTLDDLSVLCANCHRLIHAQMNKLNIHITPSEFKDWFQEKIRDL